MMMAKSSPSNDHLSMNVLGSNDRVSPVRNGSLRSMRERTHRQRQNSRKVESCLFFPDDYDDECSSFPNKHQEEEQSVSESKSPQSPHQEYLSASEPFRIRDVYAQPAVKQLQSELRHIVERALKDPSNDAAKTALERKHQEMVSLVQRVGAADDDAKVNYRGGPMKLFARRPLARRARTDGSVTLGKSI